MIGQIEVNWRSGGNTRQIPVRVQYKVRYRAPLPAKDPANLDPFGETQTLLAADLGDSLGVTYSLRQNAILSQGHGAIDGLLLPRSLTFNFPGQETNSPKSFFFQVGTILKGLVPWQHVLGPFAPACL